MTPINQQSNRHQHPTMRVEELANHFFYVANILCLISFLMIWSGQVVSATSEYAIRDPMEYFFQLSFNDLEEELQTVIDENKSGIFIMFSDKDCPWCAKMKATVMNRTNVQEYYREHFRVLTVDVSGGKMMKNFDGTEISEKDFAFKLHRVRATPVYMFFDSSGKETMRFTGITRDAKEFIWLAEYVVNGEYKKQNFTKYKINRAKKENTSRNIPN